MIASRQLNSDTSFSAYKRAENNVRNALSDGDRYIPKDYFYSVIVTFESHINTVNSQEQLEETIKELLTISYHKDAPRLPFVIYHPDDKRVILTFSCQGSLEKTPTFHNFEGSHQLLASYYASLCTLKFGVMCNCRIMEFEIRTAILLYFALLCSTKFSLTVQEKIGINCKKLTNAEIYEKLPGNISHHEMWGTFYKVKGSNIVKMSKEWTNHKIYEDFLFS